MTQNPTNPTRRRLLGSGLALGAAALLPGCGWRSERPPIVTVNRPGMELGHLMRDQANWPPPSAQWDCDLAIIGSGAAALTAAWKLAREGRRDFVLFDGPEPYGNNAGAQFGELRCPTGAHYLALPSRESLHVREVLADIGVLQGNPAAARPSYDENVLLHAPEDRLLRHGVWQEGLLPVNDADSRRFNTLVKQLSQARGDDGRKLFAIPLILSSNDTKWRTLDNQTFAQWLDANHYRSKDLRWYLNYCCRDDYGQGIDQVSAWAGLHYFCSRAAEAQHADGSAVLTWPDGLRGLSRALEQRIDFQRTSALRPTATKQPRRMAGSVLHLQEKADGVELLLGVADGRDWRTVRVNAQRVICAMPLYIAARVVADFAAYGFDAARHLPVYAPWLVSNFIFERYPQERSGAPLAWDNVVQGGKGLGYVVSTHQLIRVARPSRTAFTAYHALNHEMPMVVRAGLLTATGHELLQTAAGDLTLAYGDHLWPYLSQVAVTVRGHGMSVPQPGYLSNAGVQSLRAVDGRVLFAHADLSGYSVVEESMWWGYQAALRCL